MTITSSSCTSIANVSETPRTRQFQQTILNALRYLGYVTDSLIVMVDLMKLTVFVKRMKSSVILVDIILALVVNHCLMAKQMKKVLGKQTIFTAFPCPFLTKSHPVPNLACFKLSSFDLFSWLCYCMLL